MGKHATDVDKAVFLTHLLYVHQAEAARRAGLTKSTTTDIKNATVDVQIRYDEEGLDPPSIQEQVEQIKHKEGSGAKSIITDEEVIQLMEAYTLNKTQRKKLQHIVTKEEGFFHIYRTIIENKLRARGLRRAKSTKKLGLIDIQKAQRLEVALSRKDQGLEEQRKVIFSDEASIIVSTKRGMQNISRLVNEQYYPDYIKQRYNNYTEAIFQVYFMYDYKGPCHIYYKEIVEQKEANEDEIDRINEDEVEAKCRIAFNAQEREKEKKQDVKGQKWLKNCTSQEVYQKKNIYKRRVSCGRVDNVHYTYEVLKPLVILYQ